MANAQRWAETHDLLSRTWRRSWPGALLLVAAVGATRVGLPAVVKGKTTGGAKLLNPVWNDAKEASSNRYTWREPSPTVRAEFRTLFAHAPKEVCIAALAGPAQPPVAAFAYKITGGRTSPVTLVVAPGTQIEFQNRDPFLHRPFVVGNGSFAAADMKASSIRQWKAPAPGKYEIRDELAPSIRSWIVVDANVHAIAYPGRDGTFAFGNLAPGDYTLKAFFNGEPIGKPVPVTIKNDAPFEIKEPLVLFEEAKK